jgi:hypothetical protein
MPGFAARSLGKMMSIQPHAGAANLGSLALAQPEMYSVNGSLLNFDGERRIALGCRHRLQLARLITPRWPKVIRVGLDGRDYGDLAARRASYFVWHIDRCPAYFETVLHRNGRFPDSVKASAAAM